MLIWFNGPSRDKFINRLPRQPMEIGCNYIESVRPVDHVCAFDIKVANDIKLRANTQYHTRPQATIPGWNIIHDTRTDGGNSGVLACLVASQLPSEPIYIIGCDWGITDTSSDDHIYQTGPKRKYTNNIKKSIGVILEGMEVWIVNDLKPDVPFNIISTDKFLSTINNSTQGRTL
tara:strand:+ start:8018 stop:8542 length:525 start_codon:yes stop_codon:yes gene_type:complete